MKKKWNTYLIVRFFMISWLFISSFGTYNKNCVNITFYNFKILNLWNTSFRWRIFFILFWCRIRVSFAWPAKTVTLASTMLIVIIKISSRIIWRRIVWWRGIPVTRPAVAIHVYLNWGNNTIQVSRHYITLVKHKR